MCLCTSLVNKSKLQSGFTYYRVHYQLGIYLSLFPLEKSLAGKTSNWKPHLLFILEKKWKNFNNTTKRNAHLSLLIWDCYPWKLSKPRTRRWHSRGKAKKESQRRYPYHVLIKVIRIWSKGKDKPFCYFKAISLTRLLYLAASSVDFDSWARLRW